RIEKRAAKLSVRDESRPRSVAFSRFFANAWKLPFLARAVMRISRGYPVILHRRAIRARDLSVRIARMSPGVLARAIVRRVSLLRRLINLVVPPALVVHLRTAAALSNGQYALGARQRLSSLAAGRIIRRGKGRGLAVFHGLYSTVQPSVL